MTRAAWCAAGLSLLAACSSGSGEEKAEDSGDDEGKTDEVSEGGGCVDTETPLAWDEDTPVGRSAETVMSYLAPGAISGFGYWKDDVRVQVVGSVTADEGSAVWVDSEPAPPGEGETAAIEPYCVDRMELVFQLVMTGEDGSLALDLPMTVSFSEEQGRSISGRPDMSAVAGVDLGRFVDTSSFDTMELTLEISHAPEEEDILLAELYLQGEGSDGEVAWASIEEILTVHYSNEEGS
jgi:hypothetical protein